MNYEKAYKAVLETATQWIKDGCTDKEKICLECVFPELRESEDERVIRTLFSLCKDHDWLNGATKEECLNWLEKQKINTEGDFGRGYDCGYEACLNSHGAEWFEKQKEPHYTKRNALFDKCVENCEPEIMKRVSDEVDEMLEKEQKLAEWSKKDEEMMTEIIEFLEYAYPYDNEFRIAWLKSLRSRPMISDNWKPSEELDIDTLREWSMRFAPDIRECIEATAYHFYNLGYQSSQPHWKPGEKQMKALQNAIALTAGNKVLAELYEQLKKL